MLSRWEAASSIHSMIPWTAASIVTTIRTLALALSMLLTRAVDVTCPVCVSAVVRCRMVSQQTLVCACDQCRAIFTIQLNALPTRTLRDAEPDPSDFSD
jgi:hypothetical protein